MLEKIKNNLNKIIMIASGLAIVLYVINYFYYLEYNLTESLIITYIRVGLFIASCVILLLLAKNDKLDSKSLSLVLTLAGSSAIVGNVYNLIDNALDNNNYFGNIPYIVLYGGAVVTFLVALTNKKFKMVAFAFLGVIVVLALLLILQGSGLALAHVCVYLSILAVSYLEYRKEGNLNEVK